MDEFSIDPAKTTLTLSDKERMNLEGFLEGHGNCTNSELVMEIGHGSGIGVSVELTCRKCGGKQDITDYGIW